MAGWYGEEVELRRRITFNETMIEKTRIKADRKIAEYEAKNAEYQRELDKKYPQT